MATTGLPAFAENLGGLITAVMVMGQTSEARGRLVTDALNARTDMDIEAKVKILAKVMGLSTGAYEAQPLRLMGDPLAGKRWIVSADNVIVAHVDPVTKKIDFDSAYIGEPAGACGDGNGVMQVPEVVVQRSEAMAVRTGLDLSSSEFILDGFSSVEGRYCIAYKNPQKNKIMMDRVGDLKISSALRSGIHDTLKATMPHEPGVGAKIADGGAVGLGFFLSHFGPQWLVSNKGKIASGLVTVLSGVLAALKIIKRPPPPPPPPPPSPPPNGSRYVDLPEGNPKTVIETADAAQKMSTAQTAYLMLYTLVLMKFGDMASAKLPVPTPENKATVNAYAGLTAVAAGLATACVAAFALANGAAAVFLGAVQMNVIKKEPEGA